ncbi:hypothetical protein [Cellulomonas triticagri]|uniref:Uncharacterized protein n=1 Tax=Cellulomonas triticagri TaxID=2483352 RepID=A0A3M2J4M7_9CELL|nr:hypothetical protein [Cellulomonas triticagri]RMI07046.1 hypothetical protein EBM89_14005 [Cellulomonas triticagri]
MSPRGVVPFGLDPARLAERYRGLLDLRSDAVIAAFRAVVREPVADGVTGLDVGVHVEDGDGRWAPEVWLAWTGPHARITGETGGRHAGASGPLGVDVPGAGRFDHRYVAEGDGARVLSDVLGAWLAECWWKAGGWDLPVVGVLVHRDGPEAGREVRLTQRTERSAG